MGKSRSCAHGHLVFYQLSKDTQDIAECNYCGKTFTLEEAYKLIEQPKPKPGKVFLDMEVKVDKTLPRGTIKMLDKNGKELVRMINVGVDKSK